MVRGRKPLASAIKEASGAFAHNPQRRNKQEPKATMGWPNMPDYVAEDPVAKARWHDVCTILDELKVLTTADEGLIAGYCIDYSQMVALLKEIRGGDVAYATEKGMSTKPQEQAFHRYADRLLKREAELGLTPSARSRLRTPQAEEDDVFQSWLKETLGN